MAQAHPHFVSGISWLRNLEQAMGEARASGKGVFIQHGRRTCSGSRMLVERILAKDEILDYLAQHFVPVASDADAPESAVTGLLEGLTRREPLPVCLYLSAAGALVASTAGGRPPAVFLSDMLDAHVRCR